MTAPQRILVRSAFVAALLAGFPASKAADFNWSLGSGIWSDPLNWNENPLVPPSDPSTNLFFGGTGSTPYTATNDVLTTPLQLNSITLNSSATVANVIDGLALSFAGAVDRKITQSGSGAFNLQNDITITGGLTLTGTGTGLTTLGGVISGNDGIFVTGGNWRLTNTGSTFTGGLMVGAGAFVELDPTTTAVSIAPGASSVLGDTTLFNPITIDGGTLKFTTQSGGSITFGDNRQLIFDMNGGTLDLVNTAGGNIAGGSNDLSLILNNGTNTAVIKFNGGQNGLSANGNPPNGDWSAGNNVLRLEGTSGGGNLRLEVTNGAAVQVRTATFGSPLTVRGVVGGDPTSSPDASGNANISLNTGRFFIAEAQGTVNYSQGLTLEGAVQISIAGTARAVNGNIVVAGTASGAPGYVAFSGRGTGTALGSTVRPAGHSSTGDAGQYPLYIGAGGDDTLTIQDGGVAVFDSRIRHEQNNSNGVLLNAAAVIEGGGELRFAQSLSNATAQAAVVAGVQLNSSSNIKTSASVGHHIIDGNIQGEGSTTREAVVNLLLPAASGADTNSDGVPDTFGDLGGVVFRNSSNLVVNGTGFGGLRINANPRPNNLFDSSGTVSDPVPNADKINNLLTPARINALTGSGGYLTVAPTGETYIMPNAEWNAGVNVGLKVVNHNSNGIDVQFDPAKTSWGHNLVVDSGAELNTGANAFTLSAGTLHGTGTVSGAGGVTIDANAAISPGLDGIGTLTVGSITLGGSFLADFSNTGTSDLLVVNGNLNLGGTLIVDPASTFNNDTYTLLTYSGALSGTFSAAIGLPLGYSVSYDTAGQVRLVYRTVANLVWAGTPATVWSTSGADSNWQNGGSATGFTNGDAVTFNDSGTETTVTINGVVEPGALTFNNGTKTYTINAASGTIGGGAALVKNGSGTVILSGGSHAYVGGTEVNAGTLRIESDDVLPDSGDITVAAGATFDVNGKSDTIRNLSVSGTVTTGTLTTSSVTVEDGANLQANLKLNGNVTKQGTAGLTLSGNVDLNDGARTFTVAAAASGPGLTLSGVVSNGTLVKDGDGEMLLNTVNSYSDGTVVNAGVLKAGIAGGIPKGALTVNAGATADLNGHHFEVTSLSGDGTLAMNGGQLTLNVDGASSFGGEIAGTGTAVIKVGSGAQTLSGVSTFDGGLTINAGRVNLTNGSAAGFGDIEVNSGGSLQPGVTLFNNINLNGGTLSSQTGNSIGAAELNVTADSTVATVNQTTGARSELVFTGILRGSGNLLVTAGDVTDQPNADQGAGFRLRGISPSDYTGTVTVAQKAKFEMQMGDEFGSNPFGEGKIVMTAGTSTGSLQGTYSQLQPRLNTAEQVYNLGNDVEISGTGYVNANILGADNVVAKFGNLKIGDGQILGANKNDSAVRAVEFPIVTLTGGTAEFRAFDPAFGNTATATRGGSNIRLGDIGESETGSGVIFQSSGNDTANWINEIFGTASYTGPTKVLTGTLRVSGSVASSSEISVSAGAKLDVTPHGIAGYAIPAAQTLAGGGDWDGRIALHGILSPGTGLTMETLAGDDLTLHGDAPLKLQLSVIDNVSDRLSLSGAFDKGDAGTFVFDFDGTGAAGFTYTLVQFTSTTFTASDFSFTDLAPGLLGSFQMTATELQFVVVPEPSVAISILGGAATLLGWRRRRRA